MAALTADRITLERDPGVKWYPVAASTTIYKGSIVTINTSGYAVPASDGAGLRVVGVAYEKVDNASGSDGDKKVRVISGKAFRFAASSITQAMVGRVMYVVDDQTFDEALGTNGVKCGVLVEFVSATVGWLWIPHSTGVGVVDADADGTYGSEEATLINALKTAINQRIL